MSENVVDINPENLDAEAAAVELPPDPAPIEGQGGEGAPAAPAGEPTYADIQVSADGWRPGADFMVNTFADVLAPNWALTIDERGRLSGSIALALAAWFPDARIPIKYLVLLQVAGAGWSIVNERRDPGTGKLLPLRLGPRAGDAAPSSAPSSASSASSIDTEPKGAAGGFTTST